MPTNVFLEILTDRNNLTEIILTYDYELKIISLNQNGKYIISTPPFGIKIERLFIISKTEFVSINYDRDPIIWKYQNQKLTHRYLKLDIKVECGNLKLDDPNILIFVGTKFLKNKSRNK